MEYIVREEDDLKRARKLEKTLVEEKNVYVNKKIDKNIYLEKELPYQ